MLPKSAVEAAAITIEPSSDEHPPELEVNSSNTATESEEIKLVTIWSSIKSELTWTGIQVAWKTFWCSEIPSQIWLKYVDLLYIPAYRQEWGRYRHWIPDLKPLRPTLSLEDREARMTARRNKEYEKWQFYNPYLTHDWTGCEPITINVSGSIFITQLRTLKTFPDSVLGDDKKRNRFYNPVSKEYFFDRHAKCFEAILHYFQTKGGELNRPPNVPLAIFEDEFKFYELDSKEVKRLLAFEGYLQEESDEIQPKNLLQRKLYLLFDCPTSSYQARIVALLSVSVVIISIILFCVETIKGFLLRKEMEDLRDPFYLTETICMLWFCIELLIRFIVSPSKIKFLRNPMNIVDIVAIIPYFFQIIAFYVKQHEFRVDVNSDDPELVAEDETDAPSITVLTAVRLIRVLRIFKLSRHSEGLQILVQTLSASLQELTLLIFFLLISTVLFASALYYADHDPAFESIPDAFFFVVGTMTTVGYGDKIPATPASRLVGSICALAGVLTLALPVPVIVANFNYFYHREAQDQYNRVRRGQYHRVDDCPWREECEVLRTVGASHLKRNTGDVEVDKMRRMAEQEGLTTDKEKMEGYLQRHQSVYEMDDAIDLGPPPPPVERRRSSTSTRRRRSLAIQRH